MPLSQPIVDIFCFMLLYVHFYMSKAHWSFAPIVGPSGHDKELEGLRSDGCEIGIVTITPHHLNDRSW